MTRKPGSSVVNPRIALIVSVVSVVIGCLLLVALILMHQSNEAHWLQPLTMQGDSGAPYPDWALTVVTTSMYVSFAAAVSSLLLRWTKWT